MADCVVSCLFGEEKTGKPVSLAEAFSVIVTPRVVKRITHDLVEMRVVAVDGNDQSNARAPSTHALTPSVKTMPTAHKKSERLNSAINSHRYRYP